MSADPWYWKRCGRHDGHPPPRHRGRRLPEIGSISLSSPSPESDPDCACSLGRQLEPSRGCHPEPGYLSDNRTQAAVAKPLFHAGEHRLVVAGLDIDDAIGHKPGLRERRGEEIGLRHAPENFSLGARSDAGTEKRGGCAIYRSFTAACDLVKRAHCETSTR